MDKVVNTVDNISTNYLFKIKYKKIFKDRFFLDKTQSTIAKELDISQMTVSRLERKIVDKLRKEYEKNI